MEKSTSENSVALFERKAPKGRAAYKLFSTSIFVAICFIWLYRITHVPKVGHPGRLAWIGMFVSELVFGIYWILTQAIRWNVVHSRPFKNRLSQRYEDKLLPQVDIFVCTADPVLEPPVMVINTVLSVMAFNYPPEKLSVYLSDDGGSEFTFYALLEASRFSEFWLPFCRKFNVEPRSPEAYLANLLDSKHEFEQEWLTIKKLYEDMKKRIETALEEGSIPEEVKDQHKGFSEWNSNITKQNHQSIVQILIDRRNCDVIDTSGHQLPMLVYFSREKRPQWPHHFKAGSMNALIRVSSEISNAPIILNLDSDMYSNDPDAIRDALCFFMDETEGHEVSYVQHPQCYANITKNDLYSNFSKVIPKIEMAGLDGYRAAPYCGTGCFHRRESLCGKQFSGDLNEDSSIVKDKTDDARTFEELEEAAKVVANCGYEEGTQWGKEIGLIYGCPVEDVVTGLRIQCRGWKPIYYNPSKNAFVGIAPCTLGLALIQFKRWSEGLFQIFLSRYCPFTYGHGKIPLGAQMGYCVYLVWPVVSFPTLYYAIVPSLCLLHDVALFPEVSSRWILPFAYAVVANYGYSFAEAVSCGNTTRAWWNTQRMTLIRRTTSFILGGMDTVIRQLGFSQTSFVLTAKVVDDEAVKRYEREMMEFGTSSIMFIVITTIAVVNFFSTAWGITRVMMFNGTTPAQVQALIPQLILGGLLVIINLPIYRALFLRNDEGRIPSTVMFKSIALASIACLIPMY